MEKSTVPERPSRVTLALWTLYLSLGISVITVVVSWLRAGVPGPVGYWFINVLVMTTILHLRAQTPTWIWYGGLVSVAVTPIAIWFYYMIGKGKNWARTIVLVVVILEALDSTLGIVASLALSPTLRHSHLSLSALLTLPPTLQVLLKIIAVALLYGRVSSDWFKAVRIQRVNPANAEHRH